MIISDSGTTLLPKPTPISQQSWHQYTKPLVTVSCLTYNHAKYVRKAIEGFLVQETTFPVEIFIHDDASVDGTQDIILEYTQRYPHIVKPILQTTNQYSQGHSVQRFNLVRAAGHFIALCHGDDYWFDRLKLQLQVDAMIRNDVGISGHPATVMRENGQLTDRLIGKVVASPTRYSPCALVRHNGNMLPYCSIMLDGEAKDDIIRFMPPVRFHTGIQILAAKRSGLLVLPNVMSTYRLDVPGSTTELILGDAIKQRHTTLERIESINALRRLYVNRCSHAFDRYLAHQFDTTRNRSLSDIAEILFKIASGANMKSRTRIVLRIIFLRYKRLKKTLYRIIRAVLVRKTN